MSGLHIISKNAGVTAMQKNMISLFLLTFLFCLFPLHAFADDSWCARVKIEIRQELTLERQAFDAHMRINNGLSHITCRTLMLK
jgi:hypothetical protein